MVNIVNVIIILIVLAAIVPAVIYIVKAKKKGQACIGCPYASGCGKNCHCKEK